MSHGAHKKEGEGHSVAEGVAVGGHAGKAIIVGPGAGQISKLINEGAGEVLFYQKFKDTNWKGGEKFFPKFFGEFTNEDGHYMIMENLMDGIDKCCVLDVKMGVKTYAPDAAPEKIAHQSANDAKTTTPALGQRLTGYKTYNRKTNDYNKVGKDVTFAVKTREDLVKHYKIFFDNGNGVRKDVVRQYLPWLEELLAWFEKNPTASFYSSSVLFCYEGGKDTGTVRARLIDFAHVFPCKSGERDEGYITGLKHMIQIFKEISA